MAAEKGLRTQVSDPYGQAEEAAKFVLSQTPLRPKIAVVLGSGLGSFADDMADAARIPYANIPHFARSTAVGHAGQLVIGNVAGHPVVAMQGRFHLYEGYSPDIVVFPMRAFARMGVRAAILTNAAGGINLDYGQGRLVVMKDHINLQGQNPLVGPEDPRFGQRFIDMTDAYPRSYRRMAQAAAAKLGFEVPEGVYAGLLGPSYETPAEIRYLRTIGADLVGMSTVLEAIAARHLGAEVLAISLVSNLAAGLAPHGLDHAEVVAAGQAAAGRVGSLLAGLLPGLVPGR